MLVGIDVLDVNRMEKLLTKENSLNKIYTNYEINYINKTNKKVQRMAGIFCAKEAFLKALGIGVKNGIDFLEIEVNHEKQGRPYLILSENAKQLLKDKNINDVQISISHTDNISTAICILI